MKTKKYSNSMKIVLIAGLIFLASGIAFSQTVEERKGGNSTYSVVPGAGGEQYTWTIAADVAPVSVSAPTLPGGNGTTASPWVIDWTDDLTSIDVVWGAGASDTISTAGVVTVQMRTVAAATCNSPIQTMNIDFWSQPSAIIDAVTSPDLFVCSTDGVSGFVTIDLTGAPDPVADGFRLVYDVAVSHSDLTVTGLVGVPGINEEVNSNGATVTIPLPNALVNLHADPQYYTITLKTIEDDLDELPVVVAAQVFTITVYPTPSTGIIESTGALDRRL